MRNLEVNQLGCDEDCASRIAHEDLVVELVFSQHKTQINYPLPSCRESLEQHLKCIQGICVAAPAILDRIPEAFLQVLRIGGLGFGFWFLLLNLKSQIDMKFEV